MSPEPLRPNPARLKILETAADAVRMSMNMKPFSVDAFRWLYLWAFSMQYYWFQPPPWKVAWRSLNKKRMQPSFLSLGAARSGTTSLADYIMQHPCVVLPLAKEPATSNINALDKFFAHLPSQQEQKAIEERHGMAITGLCNPALPNLLFPHVLHKLIPNPDLKFVIILRNPVERTFAHWRWERLIFPKPESNPLLIAMPDFIDIVKMELEAAQSFATSGALLLTGGLVGGYLQNSIYLPFIKTMFRLWEPERFLILQAEEFFAEPTRVTRRVYEFLGLPDCEPVEVPARNAGRPGEMDTEAREMLAEFFVPLNKELYEFLGVDYGWT